MTPLELFGFPLFSRLNPHISSAEAGFIAADKPVGRSSFWVVKRFRHAFSLKKIGHAGTLDPAASGLMILAFGKATRFIEEVQNLPKQYVAGVRFGATTPTLDAASEISATAPFEQISSEMLKSLLVEKFTGDIVQIPPMFSALKVEGQRLYDLARKGVTIERKPRTVTIYAISLENWNAPNAVIRVDCSKGTYVRTLAEDLGKAAESLAHLISLRRTSIGQVLADEALEVPLAVKSIP